MNRRTFLQTLALTLAGLVLVNVILALRLSNTPPHAFRLRLLSTTHAETVAIGNSLIAAGFDTAVFDHASGGTSLNAGLGGVDLPQQYVAWRLLSGKDRGIKRLVFGTFDYRLTRTPPSHWTSWHSSDALAFYTDPDWTAPFGCSGTADEAAFRIMRHIPLFTERGALWGKVEHLRRILGGAGMPLAENSQFGRVADTALLFEENSSKFEQICRQEIRGHAALVPPVAALLREARQKGIVTYVVMMPLPHARQPFYATPAWRAYVDYVRSLLTEVDAQLIEATDWADSPSDFDDLIHLSKSGAAVFSKHLAETLPRLE